MFDYSQTFLEIVNHSMHKHPNLAADVEKLAVSAQGKAYYTDWAQRNFSAPSPHFIKQAVLLRNGLDHATWIETGTYLGDTTRVLSGVAKMVYSIEPEPSLFAKAEASFSTTGNVKIINGLSEAVFPELLPTLSGDLCFWLDGHYSAGETHKGPQDTPIADELAVIADNLNRMDRVVVMVDDVRCFNPRIPDFSTYPSINFLVDWANEHALSWHIEHDIFVARNH